MVRRVGIADALAAGLTAASFTAAGLTVAGLTVAGLVSVANAAPPDAGQLLQQMERELPSAAPPPPQPAPTPAPPPMRDASGPAVVVRTFRFTGNTRLSAPELTAAVAGFLNRPLSFAELQAAAAAAAETYRRSGWVVRSYLPEQDIVDGVVTIRIVEAVFGGVRLEGPPPRRIDGERIRATVARAQPEGTDANTDRLDRALLLLGDLPGLSVQGTLRSGRSERETELLLRSQDRPLVTGAAALDNFGAKSTGTLRGTGTLFLNSPFGWGDQMAVSAIGSRGNRYGRFAWSLPVGYDGWRVGLSGSYLKYTLVSSGFSGLDALGSSATAGLNASWPMLRTRAANLYLLLNADHRRLDNRAVGATVSRYAVTAASAGLNGNLHDDWLGPNGVTTVSVTVTRGRVGTGHPGLGGVAPETAVGFSKLRYALGREQQITDEVSLFTALSGQLSDRALDSSERFYVGGPDGLRAYPVDKAGGSRGQMVNAELRWRLPEEINAALFYDWGRLDVGHGLSSAGLALSWQADFGLLLRAVWANTLGKDPDAASGGSRSRVWLSVTQPF